MSAPMPPRRPPFHHDPIAGEDYAVSPQDMLDTLGARLAVTLGVEGPWKLGDWRVERDIEAPLEQGQRFAAGFHVKHSRNGATVRAVLDIAVHPSGWLEARVTLDGTRSWSLFVERVYEEFEIWPPGSPCTAVDSGRMGKRCSWVQLELAFWPGFEALADGAFISLAPYEAA